jgi:hypothetical protein
VYGLTTFGALLVLLVFIQSNLALIRQHPVEHQHTLKVIYLVLEKPSKKFICFDFYFVALQSQPTHKHLFGAQHFDE